MARTAAQRVDQAMPQMPVWQSMLSLPLPLRLLLAAQPQVLTAVPPVVHRVVTGFLLEPTGLKAGQAPNGAVTLIDRFGSAANLSLHLHCLVRDGVYQPTEVGPVFVQARVATDEELQAVLYQIIGRRSCSPPPRLSCRGARLDLCR